MPPATQLDWYGKQIIPQSKFYYLEKIFHTNWTNIRRLYEEKSKKRQLVGVVGFAIIATSTYFKFYFPWTSTERTTNKTVLNRNTVSPNQLNQSISKSYITMVCGKPLFHVI